MQHLGQGPVGPSSGYLKWSVWVVVVGWLRLPRRLPLRLRELRPQRRQLLLMHQRLVLVLLRLSLCRRDKG